jgi:hypothetical protein
VSWDFGSNSTSRLQEWLDPTGTGVVVLDQFPPLQIFANDVALAVDNLSSAICGNEAFPVFSVLNKGNEVVTNATLTYQIGTQSEISVDWLGSLAIGESEEIISPTLTLLDGNLLISSLEIDGIQDEFPDNNSITRTIDNFQDATYNAETVVLTLLTDEYASETSWEFYDQDGNLLAQSQGGFVDDTTYTETFEVDPDSCYEFVILDTANDGICCGYGNGSYSLETDSGELIFEGGDFGGSESTSFRIIDNLSSTGFDFSSSLSIYPNPASTFVQIEINSNEEFNVELFDMSGRQLYQTQMNGDISIDLNAYATGIYFVKIGDGANSITKKIIKK